ncbi:MULTISPECIES: DUF5693 family protein [unclassified Candidatus Frackibacter]|uniref:DUF5693 family protein n=1 Tax=unclassified Candidatus Frackibacter TaxID=2648818 RepID=UPI000882E30E|nr:MULTISPECIES: DUF5693 family protein [unclassified Candidatus Frackibacter]SDC83660.1 hypothetical protein SAMN04515661_12910 [Candidatus Frackibacter sp. WG11]SEM98121.1 hypothetical protein SAMN04488698_13111 [Candidatus Frackibacter sp. WG12]SFM04852.1 hypothetical protein SAMN04488699_12911 [Candidatus Frackibacter sp. WG13]
MYKKSLLLLMVVAIVVSGFLGFQRYQVEVVNQRVELILDLGQWQQLKLPETANLNTVLSDYKELGVTSLAISEQTLNQLNDKGEVDLITASELKLLGRIVGANSNLLNELDIESINEATYIFYDDPALGKKILNRIESYLGKVKVLVKNEQAKVIIAQADKEVLLELPIGLSKQQIRLALNAGLKIVPRFSNESVTNSELVKDKFRELSLISKGHISQVIFAGDEVLGYPHYLEKTSALLAKNDLKLGIIEPFIAFQQGVNRLADNRQLDSIRVHSAQQEEFDKLRINKMAERYVRAVRERDVRGLYIKPILESRDGKSAYKLTKKFLTTLTTKLRAEGYSLGLAKPFAKFNSGIITLIIINLGVLAASFYLLEYLFIPDFPLQLADKWKVLLFLLGAFILILMILCSYILLNREIIALVIAIIFPTLSLVGSLIPYLFSSGRSSVTPGLNVGLSIFIKASLITIGGVILLIGALSDWRYLLKIRQFRGIKLAFLGPIILYFLYYLHYRFWTNREEIKVREIINQTKDWLNRALKLKELFALIFLVVVGIIYIGRTGNSPLVPVPDFEIMIRRWLEEVFLVRPRFKSFLIGHPLLILGSWLIANGKRRWGVILSFGGLIGQITMLNTFSHIHTPIWVSTLRVGVGLISGALLGGFLTFIVASFINWWKESTA